MISVEIIVIVIALCFALPISGYILFEWENLCTFPAILFGFALIGWITFSYIYSSSVIVSNNRYLVKYIDVGDNCKKVIIIKDRKIIDLSEKIKYIPPENSTVEFTKSQLVGLGLEFRIEEKIKVVDPMR